MRSLVAILMLVNLGCGSSAPDMRGAAVSVTGKVSQAGQAVGHVAISFQPLDTGHMKTLPVKPDGAFQGELVSGTYAYSIVASVPESQAVLSKLAPQFLEPRIDRTIKVESGQELQIVLD